MKTASIPKNAHMRLTNVLKAAGWDVARAEENIIAIMTRGR